jgi:hypothetical protein
MAWEGVPVLRIIFLPFPAGDGSVYRISFPHGVDGHPAFHSGDVVLDPDADFIFGNSLKLDRIVEVFGINPSLVKVDVEGAECAVFDEALEMLTAARPVLSLEVHADWLPKARSLEEIYGTLRGLGFSGHGVDGGANARQLWLPM